eukprot:g3289.t1
MGNRVSSIAKPSTHIGQKGVKRALLVGCNYPKSRAELAGCVNDVEAWSELLTDCFGFSPENITILADDGGGYERPTGKNIKQELTHIVEKSRPGDIIFFEFSGHGVQVPADADGDYEEDGLDEALCPTDLNLIIDDDLRAILTSLDPGVKFTMVSDCCHSGGMLDHEEIVIEGGKEKSDKEHHGHKHRGITPSEMNDVLESMKDSSGKKNRAIDADMMAEMLQETVSPSGSDVKQLKSSKTFRADLYRAYGEDASHAALASKTRDMNPAEVSHNHYVGPGKKPDGFQTDPNKGILITGCQSMETSADVTDMRGRSFGALSHLVVQVIRRHHKRHKNKPISNRELVLKVREMLHHAGFDQNPCLECSRENADVNFVVW